MRDYMFQDGRRGYPQEKVGEVVSQALKYSRPRIRYTMMPGALASNLIPILLPKRVIDGIIGKNLGFKRKDSR